MPKSQTKELKQQEEAAERRCAELREQVEKLEAREAASVRDVKKEDYSSFPRALHPTRHFPPVQQKSPFGIIQL